MLDTYGRKYVNPFIEKGADFFIKMKLSANMVTIIALIFGVMTSLFIYLDMKYIAVAILWFSGYLDSVDGAIARKMNSTSLVGTLMDITFDRVVEVCMVLVIAIKMIDVRLNLIVLLITIILSMTVFLTVGALTQKKGMKSFYYQAGVAERSEGFIMFSLMILFPSFVGIITNIFAFMVFFTAIQRFREGIKILNM